MSNQISPSEHRDLATQDASMGKILEQVVIGGDLSKLSPDDRVKYYVQVCDSLHLNPFTKPFLYIVLNGKLTLYASRECTDQLRKLNNVSIAITRQVQEGDVYIVTALATLPGGRTDSSTGAVATKGLQGENLANAFMKAETKCKRRVTLSICGLGMLDETEVATIPNAPLVEVDMETGVIAGPAQDHPIEGGSVPAGKRRGPPSGKPIKASRNTLNRLTEVFADSGKDPDEAKSYIMEQFHVTMMTMLTEEQAEKMIIWLNESIAPNEFSDESDEIHEVQHD